MMKIDIIPVRRYRPESPVVHRLNEELGCTGHRPSSSLVPPPSGEGGFVRAPSKYFRSRCAVPRRRSQMAKWTMARWENPVFHGKNRSHGQTQHLAIW